MVALLMRRLRMDLTVELDEQLQPQGAEIGTIGRSSTCAAEMRAFAGMR